MALHTHTHTPRHWFTSHALAGALLSVTVMGSAAAGQPRAAVINPDSHRIQKAGAMGTPADCDSNPELLYDALQSGEAGDCGYQDPDCWVSGGDQPDFLGETLSEAGFDVTFFEAAAMPAISPADYDIVFVQDPLRENLRQFEKDAMDESHPDLLEHVLSTQFQARLREYFFAGGEVVLVGDAVRLLEHGVGTLGGGKTVEANRIANTISSDPDCRLPDKWLFIRGNPFCGVDRHGSATCTVDGSGLLEDGTEFSSLTLENLNDLPTVLTWSETVYAPADAVSLLSVRVSGQSDYVLRGDTCWPPVYTVSVDDAVPNYMGYTYWQDRKIYFIGSDSLFDYQYTGHDGAWHAGQYSRMTHAVSEAGRQAIVLLAQRAMCASPWDVDGDGCVGTNDLLGIIANWGCCP